MNLSGRQLGEPALVGQGVETGEQAAQLRLLGCHTAQGYLFSAPQLPGPLGQLLRRSANSSAPISASR